MLKKKHGEMVVISGADSDHHYILVTLTKICNDVHYLLQIWLQFHHDFCMDEKLYR